MNIRDLLNIGKVTNNCPSCGHDLVGTDASTQEYHGTINVTLNNYLRECRCGFKILINSDEGTSKKILNKKIKDALDKMMA